ncbi:MAG: DUF4960 domain-containing protein [Paludibacteraceae bacterium]|nr:DUF4960 domain-containing protein [Paludibacteraceae bacterium]
MKTNNNSRSIVLGSVLLALCSLLFMGCNKQNSQFNLDGECKVLTLTLDDTYQGVIDQTRRTIIAAIPETYNEQDMTLSQLSLSEGAVANIKQGEHLNLTAPRLIRVTNGSVFEEYTLSVKHDEARILTFILNGQFTGVINESAHTISVQVPVGTNIASLTPTITTSEGAIVTPASGVPCDFTNPVDFTVTCNTASYVYKVTVSEMASPHALYVGIAATQQQLNPEEAAACSWLLSTVEKAAYASFTDLAQGNVDLSECKVIWWHLHKDGGIDGKGQFEANAAEALAAVDQLKAYYEAGGNFLLTRYATYLPAYIGEADCVPNNCWGQNEADAETVGSPWSFNIAGKTDHALWQNLVMKSDELESVFTCDAGYRITNSTAQYHIGTDWGGYADNEDWRQKTGAIDIAYGDKAIVAWEYRPTTEHGAIVCIGSGCYDWYTVATDVTSYYHDNVAKITENAINYLMQ